METVTPLILSLTQLCILRAKGILNSSSKAPSFSSGETVVHELERLAEVDLDPGPGLHGPSTSAHLPLWAANLTWRRGCPLT